MATEYQQSTSRVPAAAAPQPSWPAGPASGAPGWPGRRLPVGPRRRCCWYSAGTLLVHRRSAPVY